MNDKVVEAHPQALRNQKCRKTVALDIDQNRIENGDIVNVKAGTYSVSMDINSVKKTGTFRIFVI